jgi:hypothetical protein
MTLTDIGILLVVLCIVLWAIMAALHRHTVQMEALKSQMQELLKAQQARTDRAEEAAPATGQAQHDGHDAETSRTQTGTGFKTQRTSTE